MLINTQNLLYALQFVAQTVSKGSIHPQLQGVLIETHDGLASLTTTNLEGTSRISVPCVDKETTTILVPHSNLMQYVANAKAGSDVVTLKYTGNKCVLSSDSLPTLRIPVFDPKTFPLIDFPTDANFSLPKDVALQMLSCKDYVSVDTAPMTGIHIFRDAIEATNGYIGKRITIDTPFVDTVVPVSLSKSLSTMLKLQDTVNVAVDKNRITFFAVDKSCYLAYQKVSGNYPETKRGYTNSNQNYLQLDKDALLLILNTMKIAGNVVTVTVDFDTVTFSVDGDYSSEEVLQIPSGEMPNKVKFNIEYLLMVLNNLEGNLVNIKLGNDKEPITIEENNTIYFMVRWN